MQTDAFDRGPSLDEETIVEVLEEDEVDPPVTPMSDDPAHRIAAADLDNSLDEFVDAFNARDLELLAELIAPDVEADLVGASSRDEALEGFDDLILRNPTLLLSRGDLGPEPIAVAWVFDLDSDDFRALGYVTVDLDDSTESLIQRIVYVDELPDTDELVMETPDHDDLSEWVEWVEQDDD